jgi:hypothetical protein
LQPFNNANEQEKKTNFAQLLALPAIPMGARNSKRSTLERLRNLDVSRNYHLNSTDSIITITRRPG